MSGRTRARWRWHGSTKRSASLATGSARRSNRKEGPSCGPLLGSCCFLRRARGRYICRRRRSNTGHIVPPRSGGERRVLVESSDRVANTAVCVVSVLEVRSDVALVALRGHVVVSAATALGQGVDEGVRETNP